MSSEPPVRDQGLERALPHNASAEQSLLGNVILDNDCAYQVIDLTVAEDYYVPSHRYVFSAMAALLEEGQEITPITIAAELNKQGRLESVGGQTFIAGLTRGLAHDSIENLAKTVKELSISRQLFKTANKIAQQVLAQEEPPKVILESASSQIFSIVLNESKPTFHRIGQLAQKAVQRAHEVYDSGTAVTGLSTGFVDLDSKTLGLQNSDLILIAGRPSMGKSQPLYSQLLTLDGHWVPMSDAYVGMKLASPDGTPSVIEEVFPQGERFVYRITFSDGRSTEADGEHLWEVCSKYWTGAKILTTNQVLEKLSKRRYQGCLWIEPSFVDFNPDGVLPLDPWLLGILIGDGGLTDVTPDISSTDEDILERVRQLVAPLGLVLRPSGGCSYNISQEKGRGGLPTSNPLTIILNQLFLFGKRSEHKFIPKQYLRASWAARAELLQGLMDSDGFIEKFNSCDYSSTSQQLAEDVRDLARSLGCWAKIHGPYPSSYKNGGQRIECLPSWKVSITCEDTTRLFFCSRKRKRAGLHKRLRRLTFQSIEPVGLTPAQCIKVSHHKNLYVTDHYIRTHNTAFALALAANAAIRDNKIVLFYSLEMPKESLANRIICAEARVDSLRFRNGYLTPEEWDRIHHARDVLSHVPIFIEDTPGLSWLDIKTRTKRFIIEEGVKPDLIEVDYLQLMGDVEGRERRSESRQQDVAKSSKELKNLARDVERPLAALSQLSRAPEGRTDRRPQLSDLRESGALEQDADLVMMLYREDKYKKAADHQATLTGICEVILEKNRNGPAGALAGTINLQFDEPSGQFRNYYQEQAANPPA